MLSIWPIGNDGRWGQIGPDQTRPDQASGESIVPVRLCRWVADARPGSPTYVGRGSGSYVQPPWGGVWGTPHLPSPALRARLDRKTRRSRGVFLTAIYSHI